MCSTSTAIPTTAGDFCRRFDEAAIEALQSAINQTRVRVWRAQPAAFFDEAVIDADGTLAETTGQCKEGMDISYEGVWGYHPLIVSLANTQEPLYLIGAAIAPRRKAPPSGSIRRARGARWAERSRRASGHRVIEIPDPMTRCSNDPIQMTRRPMTPITSR